MKSTRAVKNVTAFLKPILLLGAFLVVAYLVLACLGYLAPFLSVGRGSLVLYFSGCVLIFLVFARKRYRKHRSVPGTNLDEDGRATLSVEPGNEAPEDVDELRERIRFRKGQVKRRG